MLSYWTQNIGIRQDYSVFFQSNALFEYNADILIHFVERIHLSVLRLM